MSFGANRNVFDLRSYVSTKRKVTGEVQCDNDVSNDGPMTADGVVSEDVGSIRWDEVVC